MLMIQVIIKQLFSKVFQKKEQNDSGKGNYLFLLFYIIFL
jgi:hypothetical protein